MLQIGHKSENYNDFAICWHDVIVKFFNAAVFLLSSLVTGPMPISLLILEVTLIYKGLTRNPEIGNTPVWFLPNIWRLVQVRDTKYVTNVSNELLLNAAKCQGYSFYLFWVIKGNQAGVKLLPLPTHIRVKGVKGIKFCGYLMLWLGKKHFVDI